jgi:DNA repair protein RecO
LKEIFQTRALCLQERPAGKSSALLNFYCETLGPVSLYHKGFHGAASHTRPLFDLGQEVLLTLVRKEENYFLSEMVLQQGFDLSDYTVLVLASFLFELLIRWQGDVPAHPELLYQALHDCLQAFSAKKHILMSFLAFQIHLLHALGLGGEETRCSECGQIFSNNQNSFSQEREWNFFCPACYQKEKQRQCLPLELTPAERETLSLFMQNQDQEPLLAQESICKIQNHLMRIYKERGEYKTAPEILRLLTQLKN